MTTRTRISSTDFYQTVLRSKDVDEIAAALNISTKSVNQRMTALRKRLRACGLPLPTLERSPRSTNVADKLRKVFDSFVDKGEE